jgi:hypothetical protein
MAVEYVSRQELSFPNRPPPYARLDLDDETYFCPMLRIKDRKSASEKRIRLSNWSQLMITDLFGTIFEDKLKQHSDPYWILDIGCGYQATALKSICHSDRSVSGVGIDILAQPGNPLENVLVIQGDVNNLALSERAKFDLIYTHQFLQHAYSGGLSDDRLAVYSAATKRLKENGMAFFDDSLAASEIQSSGISEELASILGVRKLTIRYGVAADEDTPFILMEK